MSKRGNVYKWEMFTKATLIRGKVGKTPQKKELTKMFTLFCTCCKHLGNVYTRLSSIVIKLYTAQKKKRVLEGVYRRRRCNVYIQCNVYKRFLAIHPLET